MPTACSTLSAAGHPAIRRRRARCRTSRRCGLSVADRLAELGIPYLFVSAVYDQLVPQRHRRAAFVAKPFHVSQLQDTVRRVLGDTCAQPPPH